MVRLSLLWFGYAWFACFVGLLLLPARFGCLVWWLRRVALAEAGWATWKCVTLRAPKEVVSCSPKLDGFL